MNQFNIVPTYSCTDFGKFYIKDFAQLRFNRFLGQGGGGSVHEASWRGLKVAVKEFKPQYINSPIENNREIMFLSQLRHENIIQFIGYYAIPTLNNTLKVYAILEFCPNTLEDILHDLTRQFSYNEKKSIVSQLVNGLEYISKRHIIHRDLKPANILLGQDGRYKIADFGVSKILYQEEGFMTYIGAVGTLFYRAPEMLKEEPYSFPIDLWSLGLIIGEICVRQYVVVGTSVLTLLENINNLWIPGSDNYIDNRFVKYEKPMVDLIKHLLQIDPSKRATLEMVKASSFLEAYPQNPRDNIQPELQVIEQSRNPILHTTAVQRPVLLHRLQATPTYSNIKQSPYKHHTLNKQQHITAYLQNPRDNIQPELQVLQQPRNPNLHTTAVQLPVLLHRLQATPPFSNIRQTPYNHHTLNKQQHIEAHPQNPRDNIQPELQVLQQQRNPILHTTAVQRLVLLHRLQAPPTYSNIRQTPYNHHTLNKQQHIERIQNPNVGYTQKITNIKYKKATQKNCTDFGKFYIKDFAQLRFNRFLGQGGGGSVHEATWRGLKVAVKKFKHQSINSPVENNREIMFLSQLRHENIIQFIGYYALPTLSNTLKVYAILEFCPNTLEDILHYLTRQFSYNEAKSIVSQLVNGLEYISKRHIIHRDLKPANILLGQDGRYKIADFGCSKRLNQEEGFMTYRGEVGTLFYRAPEMLKEQPYSFPIDLWSLGLIIGEICVRQYVVVGTSVLTLLENINNLWIPGSNNYIENRFVKYEKPMVDLIKHLLQIDPSKRATLDMVKASSFLEVYPQNPRDNIQPELQVLQQPRNIILHSTAVQRPLLYRLQATPPFSSIKQTHHTLNKQQHIAVYPQNPRDNIQPEFQVIQQPRNIILHTTAVQRPLLYRLQAPPSYSNIRQTPYNHHTLNKQQHIERIQNVGYIQKITDIKDKKATQKFYIKDFAQLRFNRFLGQGGGGSVHEATWRGLKVAVKEFKPQSINSPVENNREIMFLSQLRNENIIQFIGYYAIPTLSNTLKVYAILEFCPNTLEDILHDLTRQFSYNEAKSIVRQLVNGLEYISKRHIIHRDLKPANILLGQDGRYKIADFGCSKRLNQEEGFMTYRGAVGTLFYIAPEMLKEQPYSFPIDLWSLGLIIGEICVHQYVVVGTSVLTLLENINNLWIPGSNNYIDNRFVKYEKPMVDLIKHLLQIDPSKRATMEMVKASSFLEVYPQNPRYNIQPELQMLQQPRNTNLHTTTVQRPLLHRLQAPPSYSNIKQTPYNHHTLNKQQHIERIQNPNVGYVQKITDIKDKKATQNCTDFGKFYIKDFAQLRFNRFLGQGGGGSVNEASWRGLKVAVKEFKPQSINSPVENNREIMFLSQLRHENIVKFIGYYAIPTLSNTLKVYAILEFCPNTLEDILHDLTRQFSYNEAKSIISQLVNGLEYISKRHIIHRDLKPANILLGQDGRYKIADFGVSKILYQEEGFMTYRGAVGTLFYRAPEMLKEQPYSFPIDLWSLGLIIGEICVRQYVVVGTSVLTLLENINNLWIPGSDNYIDNRFVKYEKPMVDLIKHLLQIDPSKRATLEMVKASSFLEAYPQNPRDNIQPELQVLQQPRNPILHTTAVQRPVLLHRLQATPTYCNIKQTPYNHHTLNKQQHIAVYPQNPRDNIQPELQVLQQPRNPILHTTAVQRPVLLHRLQATPTYSNIRQTPHNHHTLNKQQHIAVYPQNPRDNIQPELQVLQQPRNPNLHTTAVQRPLLHRLQAPPSYSNIRQTPYNHHTLNKQQHIERIKNPNVGYIQKIIDIKYKKATQKNCTDFGKFYIRDFAQLRFNRFLGQGGGGSVHEATWRGLKVAVKVFKPQSINSPVENNREIMFLSQLRHENIVQFIGYYALPTLSNTLKVYAILEFCPNTLEDILHDLTRQFSYNEAKSIVRQLVNGLEYISKRHIIHRDLKPANILLGQDGRYKIADFGCSKRLNQEEGFMTYRGEVGTLFYRAPEMLKEQPYSFPIDLWSLGLIIGEICVRQYVVVGTSVLTLLENINNLWIPGSDNYIDNRFVKYEKPMVDLIKQLLQIDSSKRATLEMVKASSFLEAYPQNPRDNIQPELQMLQQPRNTNLHTTAVQRPVLLHILQATPTYNNIRQSPYKHHTLNKQQHIAACPQNPRDNIQPELQVLQQPRNPNLHTTAVQRPVLLHRLQATPPFSNIRQTPYNHHTLNKQQHIEAHPQNPRDNIQPELQVLQQQRNPILHTTAVQRLVLLHRLQAPPTYSNIRQTPYNHHTLNKQQHIERIQNPNVGYTQKITNIKYKKATQKNCTDFGKFYIKDFAQLRFNRFLGQGGGGSVHEATWRGLKVAVKEFKPQSINSPVENNREIMFLSQLRHENIIQFIGYYALPTLSNTLKVYAILEFCPNTLEDILHDLTRQFSYNEKKSIVSQLVNGLEYISKRHIIHRDLKPANILLGQDGRYKIADFGVSKILYQEEGFMTYIGAVGTLFYRAPEMLKEQPYSFPIDLWSLGLIIGEICVRQYVVVGTSVLTLLENINNLWIPGSDNYIDNRFVKYEKPMVDLIKHLLQIDPSKRATLEMVKASSFLEAYPQNPRDNIQPELQVLQQPRNPILHTTAVQRPVLLHILQAPHTYSNIKQTPYSHHTLNKQQHIAACPENPRDNIQPELQVLQQPKNIILHTTAVQRPVLLHILQATPTYSNIRQTPYNHHTLNKQQHIEAYPQNPRDNIQPELQVLQQQRNIILHTTAVQRPLLYRLQAPPSYSNIRQTPYNHHTLNKQQHIERIKNPNVGYIQKITDIKDKKATQNCTDFGKFYIKDFAQLRFNRFLGQGGGGSVHEATWRGLKVAVKEFKPQSINSPVENNREIMFLSQLRHENIIQFIGYYALPTLSNTLKVYAILEFCPNTLEDILHDLTRQFSYNEAKSIVSQLVNGLEYISKRHIIHRDLKPANILLGQDGRYKIADFGCSKILNQEEGFMTNRGAVGTLFYRAPEMLKEQPYSFPIDLWSLGLIIGEICVRQYVVVGTSVLTLLENINNLWIPGSNNYIDNRFVKYEKPMVDLIKHLLQIDPSKRTTLEMVKASSFLEVYPQNPRDNIQPELQVLQQPRNPTLHTTAVQRPVLLHRLQATPTYCNIKQTPYNHHTLNKQQHIAVYPQNPRDNIQPELEVLQQPINTNLHTTAVQRPVLLHRLQAPPPYSNIKQTLYNHHTLNKQQHIAVYPQNPRDNIQPELQVLQQTRNPILHTTAVQRPVLLHRLQAPPPYSNIKQQPYNQHTLNKQQHIERIQNVGYIQKITYIKDKKATQNCTDFGKFYIKDFAQLRFNRFLGQGGGGSVHEATWRGRKVAVKEFKPQSINSPVENNREIMFLSQLRHENIVQFIGYYALPTLNNTLKVYAILEFCPNTLEDILHDLTRQFSYNEAKSIVSQLVNGLEYISKRHIIHRDLKPANILLGQDGRYKIADFGVSKILYQEEGFMTNRGAVGTLFYRAPEMLKEQPYSFPIDLWSLGLIIGEICVRQYVVVGTSVLTLLENINNLWIPGSDNYIDNRFVKYEKPMVDLIKHLLQIDPSKRATLEMVKASSFLEAYPQNPRDNIQPELQVLQQPRNPILHTTAVQRPVLLHRLQATPTYCNIKQTPYNHHTLNKQQHIAACPQNPRDNIQPELQVLQQPRNIILHTTAVQRPLLYRLQAPPSYSNIRQTRYNHHTLNKQQHIERIKNSNVGYIQKITDIKDKKATQNCTDFGKFYIKDFAQLRFNRFLGQGGGGSVHEATWRGLKVAVKEFKPQSINSPVENNREIMFLSQLRHENIIQFIGYYALPTLSNTLKVYAILEFCPNTLEDILHDLTRQFSYNEAKSIVSQLVNGLEYISKRHIIHRDLKPANILLGQDGRYKIADFGCSKRLNQEEGFMTNRGAVGTLFYRAPEMLKEEPYSFPIDLWSLGLIIGEICVRQYVVVGNSVLTLLENINNLWIPGSDNYIDNRFVKYEKPMVDLIKHLLQIDPSKRATLEMVKASSFLEVYPQNPRDNIQPELQVLQQPRNPILHTTAVQRPVLLHRLQATPTYCNIKQTPYNHHILNKQQHIAVYPQNPRDNIQPELQVIQQPRNPILHTTAVQPPVLLHRLQAPPTYSNIRQTPYNHHTLNKQQHIERIQNPNVGYTQKITNIKYKKATQK
ncbi:hypothetical protein LAZ67_3000364, partial [Cordylochernes scorpioides]